MRRAGGAGRRAGEGKATGRLWDEEGRPRGAQSQAQGGAVKALEGPEKRPQAASQPASALGPAAESSTHGARRRRAPTPCTGPAPQRSTGELPPLPPQRHPDGFSLRKPLAEGVLSQRTSSDQAWHVQGDLRPFLSTQSASLHAFPSVGKSRGEWPPSCLGPIRGTDGSAAQPPGSGHQQPAFPFLS